MQQDFRTFRPMTVSVLNPYEALFSPKTKTRSSSSSRRARRAEAARIREEHEMARLDAHRAQLARENRAMDPWTTVETESTTSFLTEYEYDPWECLRTASGDDLDRVRRSYVSWGVMMDEPDEFDMWRPSPFELLQLCKNMYPTP